MNLVKQYKKFKKKRDLLIGKIGNSERYLGDIILESTRFNLVDRTKYTLVDFTEYNDADIKTYLEYLAECIDKMRLKYESERIKLESPDIVIEKVREFLTDQKEVFQKYAQLYWNYQSHVDYALTQK